MVIKCLLRHDSQIVLEKSQKFKDFQGHLKNSSALKINIEMQALSRPAGYPNLCTAANGNAKSTWQLH